MDNELENGGAVREEQSLVTNDSLGTISSGGTTIETGVHVNGASKSDEVADLPNWYILVPTVAGWWGSSSMFSSYTKRCLSSDVFNDVDTIHYSVWSARLSAVVVSVWLSLLACSVFYLATKAATLQKSSRDGDATKSVLFQFRSMWAQAMLMKGPGFLQLCANVMTNSTVAMGTVTGATALKATEPFFVTAALFLLDKSKYQRQMGSTQLMYLTASVMGTIVAIGGAGALSFNSAFVFAMSANTLFAIRTVLIKGCQDSPQWTGDSKDLFGSCCLVGFAASTALLTLCVLVNPSATFNHGFSLLSDTNVWVSAVAYVVYNYLSFVVLGITTSVVHSVFKSGKISAILTGATIINAEPVIARVWFGLCLNALSAVLMFLSTKKDLEKRIKKSTVVANIVGLFFACYLSVFALESYRSGSPDYLASMQSPNVANMISNGATSSRTAAELKLSAMRDQRHKCVQHIRRRQFDLLGDVLIQDRFDKWGNSALLVDPAYHPNVGDHMLTLGEIEFLRSLGFGKEEPRRLKECTVCQGRGFVPDCSLEREDKYADIKLAVWHAGGNWGNLWPHVQKARLESFGPLLRAGKTIVGMPQSLHYDSYRSVKVEDDTLKMRMEIANGLGMKDHRELDTAEGMGLAKSRVILTWREQKSYDAAIELYPFVSHRLMPDIAFQLGPFMPSMRPDVVGTQGLMGPVGEYSMIPKILPEKLDLVLFMRTDYESQAASQEEMKKEGGRRSYEYWRSYLDNLPDGKGTGVTFRIVDWTDRYDIFRDSFSLFSQTSVDLLHMGRVVIADRLHANILSFLSDVPFVYVDQRTKKISSTLGVALDTWEGCRDQETLMFRDAESFEDGIDKALNMIYDNNLRDVND